MSRRTDQRRAAVFAVYQHDLTGRTLEQVLKRDSSRFTSALAAATLKRVPELDTAIERHSVGWRIDRIAPLERAVMRVALVELLHPEEVEYETRIPPEGAIDEAVETAKEFCSAQAPAFVNGILGAVLKESRENV